jgi:hypothetical protein
LTLVDASIACPTGRIVDEIVDRAALPAGPPVKIVPGLAGSARIDRILARLARRLALLAYFIDVVPEIPGVAGAHTAVVE